MRKKEMKVGVLVALVFVFILGLCASSMAATPLPSITAIQIEKAARRLHLMAGDKAVKTYTIALGSSPIGPKQFEGDGRTPEGNYIIDGRNENSSFHKSLHVSYPSPGDTERARALGKRPGGDVMIHGIKNGLGWIGGLHRMRDWTKGCIAVTDDEIEEIWASVPDGTIVRIIP